MLPTELNIKRLLSGTPVLDGGPAIVVNVVVVVAGLVSTVLNAVRTNAPFVALAIVGILMAIRGLMSAKFYNGVQNGMWSSYRARRRLLRDVYMFTLGALAVIICSFL